MAATAPRGRAGRLVPWLAAGAALALYWATAARGLAWDDSAELAAGVTRLGVVHQTGYPVYLLAGKAFTMLVPFGSAALHANLWSGLAAAAAAGLVARFVLVATGSPAGALVAAALLALGPVAWYQATVASVYPLFLLSIALLLNAADAWERRPAPGRLAWLAVAAGLAAVSHKSGWVFAVAALGFVAWRGRRELLRARNLAALAALLVPLAAIAYLPLRAHFQGFPNLRAQANASVLDWATGNVAAHEADAFHTSLYGARVHLGRLALLLLASLSPAVLLAPIGAWRLRARGAFAWCCLAPALAVSAIAVSTPGGYAYWHLPLVLAGAVAVGASLDRGPGPLSSARRTGPGPLRHLAGAALLACVAFTAVAGASYLSRAHRNASPWARATLAALSRGEAIRAPWAAYTVLSATQELEHRRRDVRVVIGSEPRGSAGLRQLSWRAYVDMFAQHPPPDPPSGYSLAPVAPAAGANVKGLSGLTLFGLRIGVPRARARAYEVQAGVELESGVAVSPAARTRRSQP